MTTAGGSESSGPSGGGQGRVGLTEQAQSAVRTGSAADSVPSATPSGPPAAPPATVPAARPGATGGTDDVVALRLPAAGAYLSVLRTVTAGLAARLDFTLEEIEDLRIAVDEACAMLLTNAQPDGDLQCEFVLTPDEIRISVCVANSTGKVPPRDTFAWTVLAALAGTVDSRADTEGHVFIDLTKRRAASSG